VRRQVVCAVFGAGTAAVLGAGVLVSPAAAAAGPQSCVTSLSTGSTQCYDTRADAEAAVAAVTGTARAGGTVVAAAASDVVIGRIYEDVDHEGAVHVYLAASGCDSDPDVDKSRAGMPSGWNDVVSSYRGYQACQLKIWEHQNNAGASYGPDLNAPTVGAMNDRASSVTFH
jgi:hypothetical protein